MATLVYTITRQPKTGLYSLRDAKARLLDTFTTFADAEREAALLFPNPRPRFFRDADEQVQCGGAS